MLVLVGIVIVIRCANQSVSDVDYDLSADPTAISFVESAFTGQTPATLEPAGSAGEWNVVTNGEKHGLVIRTSPTSDDITGFSGPTDCLIALDIAHQILSIGILSSRDTTEHVDLIEKTPQFFESFKGFGDQSQKSWADIDAVSGATLTSYAMIASVAKRISGRKPALKFNAQPSLEKIQMLFSAARLVTPTDRPFMFEVQDGQGNTIGQALSTSPVADDLIGYQGPTATLIGLREEAGELTCIGLVVDQTYDNQPYAFYLDDDYSFQKKYKGKTLSELARMHPQEMGIEGISGATMTSIKVAEAIPLATTAVLKTVTPATQGTALGLQPMTRDRWSYVADAVTIVLTIVGVAFSLTKLSSNRWLRMGYQVAVVVLLGFYSGHMLSQASLAGWAAHTVPWTLAPGLVLLSFAAVAVPMFSKHQPYCQHICPFGAMQQWARSPIVKRIIPWTVKLPRRAVFGLRCVPIILLTVVVVTAVSGSNFSLAAIEPFDGFDLSVAGWATIGVFAVGLLFSFVSPMAYCRFGCPTGAMLNFIRFRADSHRLGLRDCIAVALLCGALLLFYCR